MTKVYMQTFDYVIDDNKDPWIWANGNMIRTNIPTVVGEARDIKHGIERLREEGYIKPDPLQKALEAVEHAILKKDKFMSYNIEDRIKVIIRTLAEELTERWMPNQ